MNYDTNNDRTVLLQQKRFGRFCTQVCLSIYCEFLSLFLSHLAFASGGSAAKFRRYTKDLNLPPRILLPPLLLLLSQPRPAPSSSRERGASSFSVPSIAEEEEPPPALAPPPPVRFTCTCTLYSLGDLISCSTRVTWILQRGHRSEIVSHCYAQWRRRTGCSGVWAACRMV